MHRVLARSRSDAKALEAMLSRFFRGWGTEVCSLGGVSGEEAFAKAVEEHINSEAYNIVFLGRVEAELVHLDADFPENVVFFVVDKARVRNARLEELAECFERARALLRNRVWWVGDAYSLSKTSDEPMIGDVCRDPAADLFIGLSGFVEVASEVLGKLGENPLVVRLYGGKHLIFCGPKLTAELHIPEEGEELGGRVVSEERVDVSLESLVERNRRVMEVHEKIALSFLKRFADRGEVVVPWSGGKDSTCALLLAKKAFGDVTAVYVDTGYEFPQTKRYIEEVSKKLGVRVEVAYAKVDEELPKREPPTLQNRWCAWMKINALNQKMLELADKPLSVVGDRDAESRMRSERPPAREYMGVFQLAPIKQWSTMMAQLYLLANGVPLNPLYEMGFYRIGCTICPALRSWEKRVIERFGLSTQAG